MDKVEALTEILIQFIKDIWELEERLHILFNARNEALKQLEDIPEELTLEDLKRIIKNRISIDISGIEQLIEKTKKELEEKERDFTEFIDEYNFDFLYERKLKIDNKTFKIYKSEDKAIVLEEVD